MQGEQTCGRHPVVDRCVLCCRPRPDTATPGWAAFSRGSVRCPTCVRGAIESPADARRNIPLIREQMATLGIQLAKRVRVTLAAPDELNLGDTPASLLLGLTQHQSWEGDDEVEVLGIQIASGLTPMHFGQTVAHEIGHAWLSQRGATDLDPILAEGTCELFANAWLKKQANPLAAAIRQSMHTNPDPIYGNGFRLVRASVRTHGIASVLDHLCRRYSLP